MQSFSGSFLILFYQLALGGLFALAATPFHELDRAFYKSTGGVLLVIALLGFWGKSQIYWQSFTSPISLALAVEFFFHAAFVACLSAYIASLWTENQYFRARSFSSAILTGLAGLILTSLNAHTGPLFSLESVIYPSAFFLSALLLGSVTVGMLIGHWYLIDTGQSLDPFVRIYKFFVLALLMQSGFLWLSVLLIYFAGAPSTVANLETLWAKNSTLLVTRITVGQAAPLILSWMIWRTLLIPHTMAATGLFYIALLGVFVGEILGRQILSLSSLPF
ncbi:MAG: hypothetical protein OEN50_11130 [Deltaproteobacteria bacterium]|nr:hypothetical protein [Deltaproteobacteria bacterium]